MLKKIIKSIKEYKKATILTPCFVILEVIMEVIIPYVMAILIDEGINKGAMDKVYLIGGILIGLALLSLTFGILSGRFAAISSCGFAKNLRHDMYYKVQNYSFNNIDKFSTSSIITRLTTDVNNVQNAFQMITRIAVRAPLMLIFSLIMAFNINSKIAMIFLIIIPFLGFGLFLIATKVYPIFEKVFKTYDKLNNVVQENVRGIRVVKSFVREDYEINKFKQISNRIYKNFTKAEKIIAWSSPLMQFAMYSGIIILSWLSAKLIVAGSMTTGELTSLISYAISILSSLMMLSMIYVMCTISLPSIKRCVEILDEKSTIKNCACPLFEVKNGEIIFNDVDFSYVDDGQKNSLKDVTLTIESGSTIGIIGGTGSSKSTLVNLIPRLYDATNGTVLVGGEDVKKYDLKVLRDQVSVVLQKNVLFSGTIKENLLWGNEFATITDLDRVCNAACASEFINKFDKKYDTMIEQGGSNISGGQKQRLCIARALLKNPKILILDDSTSACDTKTDARIRASLKEFFPNVTKIIITQRIDSIKDADKVIILDNGRVIDYDTPNNLLKHNSIYQEVYYSQTKGGIL